MSEGFVSTPCINTLKEMGGAFLHHNHRGVPCTIPLRMLVPGLGLNLGDRTFPIRIKIFHVVKANCEYSYRVIHKAETCDEYRKSLLSVRNSNL